MNYKNILLLFSILIFSLTCDETTLPKDCLGDEGGTAYLDECGVCDADSNNDNLFPPTIEKTDTTELIIGCMDCTGEVGGTHWYDNCGVCAGENAYLDCAGICFGDTEVDCADECAGSATEDCTGECNGSALVDCSGECNGSADLDECGVCDGDNSPNTGVCDCAGVPIGGAEEDCTGVCNGSAELDECGECEGDNSTCDVGCGPNQPGPSGCDNACGSILVEDNCDICGGDNSTCSDCAGEFSGAAYLNECGTCICNGSESLDGFECVESDECLQDCNNDWGGDAVEDNCGICDSDPANDNQECIQDCNDDWNGTAIIDCSGECSGGNTGLLAYTICGCFEVGADNFYCHQDAAECYNTPGVDTCCENNASVDESCNLDCILSDNVLASQFSNPYIDSEECEYQVSIFEFNIGCTDDYENPNYGLVYNDTSLCEYYGCTDENATNYDETANVDVGSCTYAEASLSFGEITSTTIEIYMQNSQAVGGFQFDLTGGSFLSGSATGGSAEQNEFSVSSGGTLVFGVSFTGGSIPIGSGLLTIVSTLSISEPICIENTIISDAIGGNLEVNSTPICSD